MKKMVLKKLKLGADDMLQREQLKSILGGWDSGYDGGPGGGANSTRCKCADGTWVITSPCSSSACGVACIANGGFSGEWTCF